MAGTETSSRPWKRAVVLQLFVNPTSSRIRFAINGILLSCFLILPCRAASSGDSVSVKDVMRFNQDLESLLDGLFVDGVPASRNEMSVLSAIRPKWLAWKKEIKSQYPDSILKGRGMIRYSISPQGDVLHAEFQSTYHLDTSIQRKALELIRDNKFQAIKSESIESYNFLIMFRD